MKFQHVAKTPLQTAATTELESSDDATLLLVHIKDALPRVVANKEMEDIHETKGKRRCVDHRGQKMLSLHMVCNVFLS